MIGCYRLNDTGEWERFDVIPKIQSIIWTKRFFGLGSFQMTCNKHSMKEYDIISHEGNAGIVMRGVQNTRDGKSIYGYDLKGIAYFRKMNAETISAGKNVEKTLRQWVTTYLLTGDRAIEGLSLDAPLGNESVFKEELTIEEGTKLSEVLETQGKLYNIGWDVTFDKGKLLFSFLNSRENNETVFSRKNKTLEFAERVTDVYDEVNNSGKGIRRREGDTITEGSDYITGTATHKAVGYIIGDMVSVDEFGEIASHQITEMQYVYEPNNIIVVPSFGEVKKNIIKKLMEG